MGDRSTGGGSAGFDVFSVVTSSNVINRVRGLDAAWDSLERSDNSALTRSEFAAWGKFRDQTVSELSGYLTPLGAPLGLTDTSDQVDRWQARYAAAAAAAGLPSGIVSPEALFPPIEPISPWLWVAGLVGLGMVISGVAVLTNRKSYK